MQHRLKVDHWQLRRGQPVREEGVLVGAGVAAHTRVQPLRLEEHEVEQRGALAGEHRVAVGGAALVARRVLSVLRALDEREDDGVLLTDERGADGIERKT